MKWKKVPEEMAALMRASLPVDPRVEPRKMFGMPCAFAGGYLFFGCFEDRLILRLRPADLAEFLGLQGAEPFAPMGRTMREYALVPRSLHGDRRALAEWAAAAFGFVLSLPPKKAKAKKTASAKTANAKTANAKTASAKTAKAKTASSRTAASKKR